VVNPDICNAKIGRFSTRRFVSNFFFCVRWLQCAFMLNVSIYQLDMCRISSEGPFDLSFIYARCCGLFSISHAPKATGDPSDNSDSG
jgi:hypothetical protein